MGSKFFWIAASIGFGLLSSLVYSLICLAKQRTGFWRRMIVWFVVYTLGALIICRVLWALFAN